MNELPKPKPMDKYESREDSPVWNPVFGIQYPKKSPLNLDRSGFDRIKIKTIYDQVKLDTMTLFQL